MTRPSQFRSFKFGSRNTPGSVVGPLRERECLDYIAGRIKESGGIPPTVQEIGAALAIKSKSGVVRLLTWLEAQGKIRRMPKRARALEIVHNPKPALDLGRHAVFLVERVDGEATLVERT